MNASVARIAEVRQQLTRGDPLDATGLALVDSALALVCERLSRAEGGGAPRGGHGDPSRSCSRGSCRLLSAVTPRRQLHWCVSEALIAKLPAFSLIGSAAIDSQRTSDKSVRGPSLTFPLSVKIG